MSVSVKKESRSYFQETPLSTIIESSREEDINSIVPAKEKSSNNCLSPAQNETLKCFVFDEDKHIFQHPLQFERIPVQFRVSKICRSDQEGCLRFIAHGPAESVVRVCNVSDGVERCEVTPAAPGSYVLEILWKGNHIPGSPYSLVFNQTKSRIISDGLDLDLVKYRLGVEHRFKIDCSSLKQGELKVTISPPSVATIEVTNPPDRHYDSHQCRIMPLIAGSHELAVTYSGKHIYGSPFHVQFNQPGDASKCVLTPNSTLHRVGNTVSFKVSTKGAGFGQLRAGVKDITNDVLIDVHVTRTLTDEYVLDFNPGRSLECVLAVKYDNSHISGSPFQLLFNQLASCAAEGAGLVSAHTGAWNMFNVKAQEKEKCQGALKVNVNRADGERVETVVSARTPFHFDVSYFPRLPGTYVISLQWGDAQVPGSPFQISCYPASFVIVDRPSNNITLGSCVQFEVQPLSGGGEMCKKFGVLRVSARDSSGKEIVGCASLQEDGSYKCTLTPERPGKCPINVKLNDIHIIGSPFVVTVINSPNPNLVQVRGRGILGATVGEEGNFSVDISRAGAGLLSVSVCGYSDIFNICTNRTPGGLIHVSYRCVLPGVFLMDVTWSGKHVPGSPFTIVIATKDCKKKDCELKPLDKHKMFLGNVTSVGINGEWLKVWRSSSRFKHRRTNSKTQKQDGVGLEEGLTYL